MILSDETVQFARVALQMRLDKIDYEIGLRVKDIQTHSTRIIEARGDLMNLEDQRKPVEAALLEIAGQPPQADA